MVILPTGLSPRGVREKFFLADISVPDHFSIHVITLVIQPVFIPEPGPEMLLISLESKLADRLLQLSLLTGELRRLNIKIYKTALRDKTDAQCAQICLNRNVFRTRKEIQPCTGAVVNEEVEPCGVAGSFGPFSDWTESDATCGGNQWRWQIHSCDIDTATGRPKVRLSVF